MRKYMTALVGVAFLLFTLGAMAQTSSSSSSGQYGNPSASTSSQSQSQTESYPRSSTSSQATATGEQRTLQGCVAEEQGQFFLIPQSGNPIRLEPSSRQSLEKHVGQQVTVSGNESSLSASAGSSGGMAGTTAGTNTEAQTGTSQSGAVGSQTGQPDDSGSMSSQTGQSAGTSGSMGSQMGQSGSMNGGANQLSGMADRQISVQSINKIASSCPANWNPNFPQAGTSGHKKY